jgi:hypothetical protein
MIWMRVEVNPSPCGNLMLSTSGFSENRVTTPRLPLIATPPMFAKMSPVPQMIVVAPVAKYPDASVPAPVVGHAIFLSFHFVRLTV